MEVRLKIWLIKLLRSDFFQDCENFQKFGQVLDCRIFVHRDTNGVLIDLAEVDAKLVEFSEDCVSRAKIGGVNINSNGVKEVVLVGDDLDSHLV